MSERFEAAELRGLYRAIFERRDVRGEFLTQSLPDELLERLLEAAHHAPSVGFMQPWRFILIRDAETRTRVHDIFARASERAAGTYDSERQAAYRRLKLAGLREAPLHLCVVCDETSSRGAGLGRQTMPETALYSVVCAVQNLWLAARAEGVGVGWVSILDVDELRALLEIPAQATVVAYLCVGYVSGFHGTPDLERAQWEARVPLAEVCFEERYGRAARFAHTEPRKRGHPPRSGNGSSRS